MGLFLEEQPAFFGKFRADDHQVLGTFCSSKPTDKTRYEFAFV